MWTGFLHSIERERDKLRIVIEAPGSAGKVRADYELDLALGCRFTLDGEARGAAELLPELGSVLAGGADVRASISATGPGKHDRYCRADFRSEPRSEPPGLGPLLGLVPVVAAQVGADWPALAPIFVAAQDPAPRPSPAPQPSRVLPDRPGPWIRRRYDGPGGACVSEVKELVSCREHVGEDNPLGLMVVEGLRLASYHGYYWTGPA